MSLKVQKLNRKHQMSHPEHPMSLNHSVNVDDDHDDHGADEEYEDDH